MSAEEIRIETPLSMPLVNRIAFVAQKIQDGIPDFYDRMRLGEIDLCLNKVKVDDLRRTFIYRITFFEKGEENDLSETII